MSTTAKPYQQASSPWPAWVRFFLMLSLMLLLNSAWAYVVLYIDFVKVPRMSDSGLALVQSANKTNALIRWGLGMTLSVGLLGWSLRKRHVGEAVAVGISMLWLTYLSFCFYLLISLGYGMVSVLEAIQRIKL